MNPARLATLVLTCSLNACTTTMSPKIGAAAATPLSDLNLIRTVIPPVLEEAQARPYLKPADLTCAALALEIARLDEVLGADLDTPASAHAPTLIERGAETAQDSAIDALQRSAEGLIPFRQWVRKLTGAEHYAKQVAAAIAAGSIRRAFLKGVSVAQACPPTHIKD